MGFRRTSVKPGSEQTGKSRRGTELVEGMLVILPFLALVFLIIDASYGIFVKATLQNAAQTGVTFAVLGNTGTGGQSAAIQAAVQGAALGLLNGPGAVTVSFYASNNLTTPLQGAGANANTNVVEVDVSYQFTPLAPLFRSGVAIPLSASAAGVLTGNTNPPPAI